MIYIAVLNNYKNKTKNKFICSKPIKIKAKDDDKAIVIAIQECSELNLVSETYYECNSICKYEGMKVYSENVDTKKYIESCI
jgi:hypothetical protein